MQLLRLDGDLDQTGEHFLQGVDKVAVQRHRQFLRLDEGFQRFAVVDLQQIHVGLGDRVLQVAEDGGGPGRHHGVELGVHLVDHLRACRRAGFH